MDLRPPRARRLCDARRDAGAGLGGCSLADRTDQVSASLVSLACCAAVFLGLGAAIWSQLTIGWQWSAPDARATTVAIVMLSATMLAFAVAQQAVRQAQRSGVASVAR
jgi:hypothetical protein